MELDALNEASARVLHDGQLSNRANSADRLEHDGQVTLTVHDSGHTGVIRTAQLIGQEGTILEVVIGLDLAVLEVVGNQQDLQLVIGHELRADEVEGSGGGLAADAVVDHTRTLGLLSQSLIHGIVGIQDAHDVGRNTHAEMTISDVPVVLHLHGALIQEGNEFTLQPLQVTISEVGRSLEAELSIELVTGIQTLLQTLILHARADHSDVLGHGSDDISVSKVLNAVADIGTGFLRQAHLDMRTSRDQELLEVVLESSVDGVSMLSVRHGSIEVHLGDLSISMQISQNGAIEIELSIQVHGLNSTISLLALEGASQSVGLTIEVRSSTLGHGDILLINSLTINSGLDLGNTDIAVHTEQGVRTSTKDSQVLATSTRNQTIGQGLNLDLSLVDEGSLGIGGQSINQVFLMLIGRSLDGGDNLFDLNELLLQRTGIIQTMQDSLVRSTHGSSNRSGQGNQAGHNSRLVHGTSVPLGHVVHEHLSSSLSILLQHGIKLLATEQLRIMLIHGTSNHICSILDLHGTHLSTANTLIANGVGATLQTSNNISNVVALIKLATKQLGHIVCLLSNIKIFVLKYECYICYSSR
nr:MAG TPA: hypothetical protein [Bacteriophage sp.]